MHVLWLGSWKMLGWKKLKRLSSLSIKNNEEYIYIIPRARTTCLASLGLFSLWLPSLPHISLLDSMKHYLAFLKYDF